MKRVVVAVAALVLLGLGASLLLGHHRSTATESARIAAVEAGPALVEDLLGYNSETVDDDLARAAEGAHGAFRESFVSFGSAVVAPRSKDQGISTKARVVDVGVLTAATDHATLLMFVDQITTSIAQPAPASTSSRVQVSLDRIDGRWLVGEMRPL